MVPLGRLVLPRFSLQLEFLHQRFCDREKKQRKFVGYLVVVRARDKSWGFLSFSSRKEGGTNVDRDADLGVEISSRRERER